VDQEAERVKPYYERDGITIYHGDCMEILPSVGPVDMIAVDPPYGGAIDEDWDKQWRNDEEFLTWIEARSSEWHAALRANGSLYCFASASMAARVSHRIGIRMNVLADIVWLKPGSRGHKARKEDLRNYFPETERIIFAEHYGADNIAKGEAGYVAKCDELRGFVFEPLRAYLAGEWERAGLSRQDANDATGTQMSGHYFSRIQWTLPTAKHYAALQARANATGGGFLSRDYGFLSREYEELRREYEELSREYEELRREYEELRRPFRMRDGMQWSDVWQFGVPLGSVRLNHPCQKPIALVSQVVRVSSRPGDMVLDPFMGSGTTLVAAKLEGRRAIGIEIEERYCEIAAKRLAQGVLDFSETAS